MKNKVLAIFLVSLGVLLTVACNNVQIEDNDRVYNCDVKNPLKTKIITELNGDTVTIKGDWKLIEDPLDMVNSEGEVIANAGDDYNFIDQDDHAIYVNGDLDCFVKGELGIVANHYTIYDEEHNEIAKADFNGSDTYGSITSGEEVWVEYSSGFAFYDYKVVIHENCEISDESVLMIMASYKSDRIADSN